MLFNSYSFIFVFLPITLIGLLVISKRGYYRSSISWLVMASLFFYGWWNPIYLGLILCSILLNYTVGSALSVNKLRFPKKWILIAGITANLGLLGYFKYANFFINNWNLAFSTNFHLNKIILPLAISFFTLQQISYLVEAYYGKVRGNSFLNYCLFVTFFPQLIAGPIVYQNEMLPQYGKDWMRRLNHKHIAVGLTVFSIGLFKKVVIADNIAILASPLFSAAEKGIVITIFEAWGGALAYTFQLYYDFSGYSDMAIGLAQMFGIYLPLNFYSPYKANNIIEFWRRWHITLSRFLKNYLYIPLGGNRNGRLRQYTNLMITMLIGGLWHGANWTFVIWGALHGFYLIVNHGWHKLRSGLLGHDLNKSTWFGRGTARIVTFFALVVGWVFFRAESLDGAMNILSAMFGGNGIFLPMSLHGKLNISEPWFTALGFTFGDMFSHNNIFGNLSGSLDFLTGSHPSVGILYIVLLLIFTWLAPNTQQFMTYEKPALETYRGKQSKDIYQRKQNNWYVGLFFWKPTIIWAILVFLCILCSVNSLSAPSEFLYFQF